MENTAELVPIQRETKGMGAMAQAEASRAIQEVQASMVIAKNFPRDQDDAYLRIMKACERYSLAEQAEYAYPRGGATVTGPSIRLAEAIAQNWGNLQFGIRELTNDNGESEIEAFAWDIETNTRSIKTFKVAHQRYTKAKGNVALFDPRDIYEHVANQGARRMRACILAVVPGDIVEAAVAKCRETVKKGIKSKPMADQIRAMLKHFESIGVTKTMIEKRLGHETGIITEDELANLRTIYRSLSDNMTKREEWFDLKVEQDEKASDLTKRLEDEKPEPPAKKKGSPKKKAESESKQPLSIRCPKDDKMRTLKSCEAECIMVGDCQEYKQAVSDDIPSE